MGRAHAVLDAVGLRFVRKKTRLLFRADIQRARFGAGQPCVRGGVAGVSEGTAGLAEEKSHAREKGEEGRETLERRQRERREEATARLVPHGLSILNIARHCLKEQEREKNGSAGQSVSAGTKGAARRFKHWLGKRNPRLGTLWRSGGGLRQTCGSGRSNFPGWRIGRALSSLSGNSETAFFRYASGAVAPRLHDGRSI